jgi:hypothetical protein
VAEVTRIGKDSPAFSDYIVSVRHSFLMLSLWATISSAVIRVSLSSFETVMTLSQEQESLVALIALQPLSKIIVRKIAYLSSDFTGLL